MNKGYGSQILITSPHSYSATIQPSTAGTINTKIKFPIPPPEGVIWTKLIHNEYLWIVDDLCLLVLVQ